ncbi:hypothetical protein [Flavobacterium johnsoniae]|uniref:Uncharacterized protein n=1 Tax=Flavobacterium johnsoniae TaxID=986 RepID=A0A1M5IJF8_FLAJO|nr:hypothetical protein [Flavobacterium johnsoniae]SHG27923.1 hypothetical protein SAMN05444388_102111 [Flavobacterium johnsoniae]
MKQIKIILVVFFLAFATSVLFDWCFIAENLVRKILVVLLIIVELIIGLYLVKAATFKNNNNE